MQNNYLTDQEFSESIYSYLEQQRRNSLSFLEVLFGKKSADEVLELTMPAA
ncbi:MAG: hypothetical protein HUK06_04495 [Bacteroidaceae bacterium]|nr:hypothetical protein [Bacteroidaceae bacterium]